MPMPAFAQSIGSKRKSLMQSHPVVPEQEFKLGMRQIASSVAIVTSRAGSMRNGLTATAVCSVSAEPPTMLACVNRNASAAALIASSGSFAINFLAEEQHNIARLFSKSKLHPDERFAEGRWKSIVTGAPILEGAAANFDCQVEECVVAGSHHIYFGRVVAVASIDTDTLLYRNGLFRRLAQVD
jgi:flavin reductase